jgi:Glycosyl transferase family 2
MSRSEMISLVLPCRNQGDHIGAILPRYLRPLEGLGLPFELVVVPNASMDATQEVVENLARQDRRIRVVANPAGGWGRSVRTGLDACRGSVLAYTNTARTDPQSVPDFIRLYLAGAQQGRGCLVKARREARNAPLREFGSLLYNLEARLCFGIHCHDVNGTPKVFSSGLYHSINLTATGDLIDLELMRAAARRGIPVLDLVVRGFKRHGGKSSTTFQSAWNMYTGALKLWLTGRAA